MSERAADKPVSTPGRADDERTFVAAPTWRRWLALLLDAAPLVTVWLLCAFAIAGAGADAPASSPWNPIDQLVDFINTRPVAVALILVMLAALGFAWPLVAQLAWGRTPGKRVLGLTVVDAHGEPPSRGRTATWCALRVAGVAALFFGVLWAIADPERRTLYDRLAGVWVVRAPSD
ncbi:MAG: hypothetical protein CVU56_20470 [Deltaproteobacteria bacterium HGW-Deltaproteobacteria-14]|jgi:uncharacterized RDD family membrane protein YckC|nr:MAG: hypothetical protein CVU56_20470 [Deltaproteobacteria bacterium HGW-Deltaproteobacteria-14]